MIKFLLMVASLQSKLTMKTNFISQKCTTEQCLEKIEFFNSEDTYILRTFYNFLSEEKAKQKSKCNFLKKFNSILRKSDPHNPLLQQESLIETCRLYGPYRRQSLTAFKFFPNSSSNVEITNIGENGYVVMRKDKTSCRLISQQELGYHRSAEKTCLYHSSFNPRKHVVNEKIAVDKDTIILAGSPIVWEHMKEEWLTINSCKNIDWQIANLNRRVHDAIYSELVKKSSDSSDKEALKISTEINSVHSYELDFTIVLTTFTESYHGNSSSQSQPSNQDSTPKKEEIISMKTHNGKQILSNMNYVHVPSERRNISSTKKDLNKNSYWESNENRTKNKPLAENSSINEEGSSNRETSFSRSEERKRKK